MVRRARRCLRQVWSVEWARATTGLPICSHPLNRGERRLRMIYKILAGTLLALAVLIFVALRVNTTGSYERTFNASSDKLWQVWNDPEFIKKWWGPKDFTAPIIRNDRRVGGTFLWSMKSSKGEMFWNTGVYKEVL